MRIPDLWRCGGLLQSGDVRRHVKEEQGCCWSLRLQKKRNGITCYSTAWGTAWGLKKTQGFPSQFWHPKKDDILTVRSRHLRKHLQKCQNIIEQLVQLSWNTLKLLFQLHITSVAAARFPSPNISVSPRYGLMLGGGRSKAFPVWPAPQSRSTSLRSLALKWRKLRSSSDCRSEDHRIEALVTKWGTKVGTSSLVNIG